MDAQLIGLSCGLATVAVLGGMSYFMKKKSQAALPYRRHSYRSSLYRQECRRYSPHPNQSTTCPTTPLA